MIILPIGNQKLLAEKHNHKKVSITLLIKELGYLLTIFGKMKMTGILMTIFWAGINALAFVATNYKFNKSGQCDAEVEWKRYDLAEEKLQKAKDKWNQDRIKRLDVINQRLHQRNKAKVYINSVDEAMVEDY